MRTATPRDGAIIFRDLVGQLDMLRVSCEKCGRSGRYQVQRLIKDRGQRVMKIKGLPVIDVE